MSDIGLLKQNWNAEYGQLSLAYPEGTFEIPSGEAIQGIVKAVEAMGFTHIENKDKFKNAMGSADREKNFHASMWSDRSLAIDFGNSKFSTGPEDFYNQSCIVMEWPENKRTSREEPNIRIFFYAFEPEFRNASPDFYEKLSQAIDTAIPGFACAYADYQNSPERSRANIEAAVEKKITMMCATFARKDSRYFDFNEKNPDSKTDSFAYAKPLAANDEILPVLKAVHDACAPFSLIPGSAVNGSGAQAASDNGVDLFMKALTGGASRHLDSFDSKAKFSALALHLAWLGGDVQTLPPNYASYIDMLPRGTEKYYGFDRARDSSKAMSFGGSTPGRFESSMSRKIVSSPEDINLDLAEMLDTLVATGQLASDMRDRFQTWWKQTYYAPIEQAVSAARTDNDNKNSRRESLFNNLAAEYRTKLFPGKPAQSSPESAASPK